MDCLSLFQSSEKHGKGCCITRVGKLMSIRVGIQKNVIQSFMGMGLNTFVLL